MKAGGEAAGVAGVAPGVNGEWLLRSPIVLSTTRQEASQRRMLEVTLIKTMSQDSPIIEFHARASNQTHMKLTND